MAIDGYGLFRRLFRWGRRGGDVALYVKKWIECEELSLRNSHEQVESLWVGIGDLGNKGNLVAGVYSRPPNQGEPTDEAFFLLELEASFFTLAGSCPAGGLQPPQHLLEK